MAALTEISFYSRKIIKIGFFLFIGFFVAKFILQTGVQIWNRFNPAPAAAPTVSFGKLPAINFSQKEKIGGLNFKLETPTGVLPQFPDRLKVFFMPSQRPNLLALDRARQQAASLGFKAEPKKLSEKIYQWEKTVDAKIVFKIDIFSGSFVYNYDWQSDQSVLAGKNIPGEEGVKKDSLSFLSKALALEMDLSSGRIEVNYLQLDGDELVPAIAVSEANFVKVDIFRQNIEELEVLTTDPAKGMVSFLVSGAREYEKKIVEVVYNYYPVKYDSWGTYPIKTADQAWQELKSDQGFVSRWDGSGSQIIIRRVYLAYFDSEEQQKFLQPIIVFEGDDNFFGYVPAIVQEWYQ